MFKTLQHLLPNGRALRTTAQGKDLTKIVKGFAAGIGECRYSLDEVYRDINPQSTGSLDEWDDQFGLPPTLAQVSGRRARLQAAWAATGGQSPEYVQRTLRGAGFNVYVHEWWEPGTESAPVARDPLAYLTRTSDGSLVDVISCGSPSAYCNGPEAYCGNVVGAAGYPLVNKVPVAELTLSAVCGHPTMLCGGDSASCGNGVDYASTSKIYSIPDGVQYWPHFIYIGGEVFPSLADVPVVRRGEFEDLVLKIRPLGKWVGILVNYV